MPLLITPEVGIPLPLDVTPEEVEQFRERAAAACKTIQELMDAGGEVEVTDADSIVAHQMFASQRPLNVAKTPPGAILKLEAMLSHYDHEFLGANRRIANYVTNRLLEETEDEDPKVRLKALELLGKRKGVNLFSDQMEITVKQKSTTDLEGELATLLEKYMGNAEVIENPAGTQSIIDIDAELAELDAPEPTEPAGEPEE
jgi:HEAT repeat protein